MSLEFESQPLTPRIATLLDGLRVRIRSYVWTHGLAAIVVALGLAFWLSLAFDWLFEPPWQFRACMLVVVAGVLGYVVNRMLIRRGFQKFDDTNLAVVLERRFRDYRDSLLTTVELGRKSPASGGFSGEMFKNTQAEAAALSQRVRLGEVFRMAPLVRSLAFAAALAVSVLAFAVLAQPAFGVWINRVLLLDKTQLWPRANHVRVQGFPANRVMKVAKGSDFEVVAAADLRDGFTLPANVQVRYRTEQGTKGRDNMSTVGTAGPRDQEQKYSYLFKGIMSSIGFDVFGGDDRDRDYKIEVVDNPTLSKMELECVYPPYTGRPNNTVPASALVPLPQGTKVTIHCTANKDLLEVPVTMVQKDNPTPLTKVDLSTAGDRRQFSVNVPELMEDTTLLFDLHDADGIHSRDPVRLVLAARPDDTPSLALRLRGISTAITPQARLPVVGDVHDDYGLTRLWFEYQLEKSSAHGRETPAETPAAEEAATPEGTAADSAKAKAKAAEKSVPEQSFHTSTFDSKGRARDKVGIELADNEVFDLARLVALGDLLKRHSVATVDDLAKITSSDEKALIEGVTKQQQIDLALAFTPLVGDRLQLALKAADNCELPQGKNIGQGERYQLDIVSPEQLVSMLEGRELMLRRRFEIIYQEMVDTRDGMARMDFAPPDLRKPADDKAGHEPGDDANSGDEKSGGKGAAKPVRPAGAEPGDLPPDAVDPNETPQQRANRLTKRSTEMRDLRVARALDNSDRSAHETQTVAEAFDDIREEMTNNRVDTPELQGRLKDQIAEPLKHISGEMFPELRKRLEQLRRVADDPKEGPAQLKTSLAQADAILLEMKQVLDKMLELETFNEVVDTLRDIITTQEKINQETLKRQKEDLKNKLRDLEN
jgi:hypothetical protein